MTSIKYSATSLPFRAVIFGSILLHLSLDSIFVTAQFFCPMPILLPGHELTSCKGYDGMSSTVNCTKSGEPVCEYSSICLGLTMFSREECGYESCSYDKAAAAKCEKQETDNPITCESPVTGEKCTYENRCFALHAGFQMKYCMPKSIEEMCAKDIEDWHVCSGEKFKNPCHVIKAGFLLEKCERIKPVCPDPDPTSICPAYVDEVICTNETNPGYCKYGNPCWAYSAGYDASTQCKHLNQTCPLPDESLVCPRHIDPVQCTSKEHPFTKCTFNNECLAKAAGYNTESECKLIKDHPKVCSKVPKRHLIKCASEEEEEVVCGPNKCIYDNMCIAKKMGYWKKMCKAKEQNVCPKPNSDLCIQLYKPVTCGENQCQYDNKCIARSAGFRNTRELCCNAPILTNIRCPGNEEPVACGHKKNKCIYRNRCFAKAAKQKACCRLAPKDVETTCTDYAPVSCGTAKCEYDSSCHAKAAGARRCCPLVPKKTICPEIFKPVKCGACEYENKCLANAAGAKRCCPLPPKDANCEKIFKPVKCGRCKYNNICLADAAGAKNCNDITE